MEDKDTILQQFRTPRGCLSYIVGAHGSAAIIDPLTEIQNEVYRDFLRHHGLSLRYIVDTHTHADHISSSKALRENDARIVMHTLSPSPRVDLRVKEGGTLAIDNLEFRFLETPGHAPDELSVYVPQLDAVFTGDTLLIEGTGRADFDHSDPVALYESLQNLMSLPDTIKVYPGHEYQGRTHSTIEHERKYNPRLQLSREDFIRTMRAHRPPYPELFKESLAANSA